MRKLLVLFLFAFSIQAFSQDTLPNVNVSTLDGDNTTLTEAAQSDNPVVISLWATWCVPCLKELDAISEVYADWQSETNVELIAVSIDDSRTVKRVKPLINGKGWDYTILLDTNNDVKRALGAATVPLTVLVKDGKIVYRHSGYNPGAENELYEKIQEYSK
ncbi:MAG TPA: TlpA disulfide reductase family protein [Flavobacteriaceae bacterium]|nr:TlpA family protein disulfide reductase [Flavobacteriaceae bacterium]MCB9213124.1 TlpA family protein disulfide reductase [Alteromonas sp.]HPF11030.1 TlpA disulfide reductase family protein [Flavobacteriaceae bacterium]HQU21871.1 TlpA disulfide reductase family protein [Flavobacteriaceae bacterium]HQU64121.1 TlpA disulfide reductase family protein [Flavobacteriaceae bacterium]